MTKTVNGWCLKGDKTNTTERIEVGEGFFFVNNNSKATQTVTITDPTAAE